MQNYTSFLIFTYFEAMTQVWIVNIITFEDNRDCQFDSDIQVFECLESAKQYVHENRVEYIKTTLIEGGNEDFTLVDFKQFKNVYDNDSGEDEEKLINEAMKPLEPFNDTNWSIVLKMYKRAVKGQYIETLQTNSISARQIPTNQKK